MTRSTGFPAWLTLFLFSHQWSESDSGQQSFWSDETDDSLAPRFLLVLYEHSMPLRLKLLSRLFDIVNLKLKPSLWRRNFLGTGVFAKTGLRCLRKRPQSEAICAL
jgi:hypothetical protein